MGSQKKLTEIDQYVPAKKDCPKLKNIDAIISSLYRQKELPIGTIPFDLIKELVELLNPNYKPIALAYIGGESFLLKVEDILNNEIAVKIAFPIALCGEGTRNVIHWANELTNRYEIISSNITHDRFKIGAGIQQALNQSLTPEDRKLFDFPRIIEIRQNPLCIFMAWAKGETFKTWIMSKPTIRERLLYFRNLLKGVLFAHQRGVIHRDLKPENLIFGDGYKITIVDWTLARKVIDENRNLTVKGTMLGSPAYASPQQLEDASNATYLDDIFYLGFTLASFIMGAKMPIPTNKKDTLYQRKAKFRKLIVDSKLDFPVFFHPTFLKATDLDPLERFQDIEEFLEDIENLLYQLENTEEGKKLCFLPDTQYPKMTFDPNDERNIPTIITSKENIFAKKTDSFSQEKENPEKIKDEKIDNETMKEIVEIAIIKCKLISVDCKDSCEFCAKGNLLRSLIKLILETINELKKRKKI